MSDPVYSLQAERDMRAIARRLRRYGADIVDRFTIRFDAKAVRYAENPFQAAEREDIRRGLRSFVVGRYVAFYRPAGDTIVIVRVLHGARDAVRVFGPPPK